MTDKKKKGVVEVYTDEQYKRAQDENKIIIDRRHTNEFERSGRSEAIDVGE